MDETPGHGRLPVFSDKGAGLDCHFCRHRALCILGSFHLEWKSSIFLQTICSVLHVSFGMRKWSMSILGMCVMYSLAAQSTVIQWSNPSFEDVPGPGRPPLGWYFCGPPEETPPDVQPVELLGVTKKAVHGKTYAGLVVRDNETQETLGQNLDQPILEGNCYLLRFYACMSEIFSSVSRLTREPSEFSHAVKLQIWGGQQHCDRKFLLAETEPVTENFWQIFHVFFNPPADCDQLFLTAAFNDAADPYNGHILIDNLSPIVSVNCDDPANSLKEPSEIGIETDNLNIKEAISREIPDIRWARNGFSLEQDFFQDPMGSDELVVGNKAIYRISHHLQTHPDALLTVVVGPRKDPLVQHHIRLLAAEFMASGLSPERCLIRPMKKRDLKKDNWLNEVSDEVDVLWGVSE